MKTVLLFIITICFLLVAGTHYVSTSGSGTWAASTNITTPCSISTGHYLVHLCASNCDSSQTLTLINLCGKPAIQLPINGATGVSITPALNSRRIK